MSAFNKLVYDYERQPMNCILLTVKYGEEMLFCHKVLLHKLEKHLGDPRQLAVYLSAYLKDRHEALPSKAIEIAKEAGLKRQKHMGVGYLHSDGTYHWFSTT